MFYHFIDEKAKAMTILVRHGHILYLKGYKHVCVYTFWPHCDENWSSDPNFLSPGTGFMEDNFSRDGNEEWFGFQLVRRRARPGYLHNQFTEGFQIL